MRSDKEAALVSGPYLPENEERKDNWGGKIFLEEENGIGFGAADAADRLGYMLAYSWGLSLVVEG